MALAAVMALLGPGAARADTDEGRPMDPLGANFGPAHPSDGDGPRTPRKPDGRRSADEADEGPSSPSGRRAPATVPRRIEVDDADTGGSVADRIARAWPGNDRRALRVVRCESGLDPDAYSPAGPYYGLWQFDVATWRRVGGSGLPSQASVEEQTRRAWELRSRRGWAPWPVCGRV